MYLNKLHYVRTMTNSIQKAKQNMVFNKMIIFVPHHAAVDPVDAGSC